MKTKLNIAKRIMLSNMMPQKAKFEIGIIINDVQKKLAITQEEVKRTGLTTTATGGLSWNAAKDRAAEYEFTDAETEIIAGALKAASDKEELPTDAAAMDLYRDFVINPAKIKKLK